MFKEFWAFWTSEPDPLWPGTLIFLRVFKVSGLNLVSFVVILDLPGRASKNKGGVLNFVDPRIWGSEVRVFAKVFFAKQPQIPVAT